MQLLSDATGARRGGGVSARDCAGAVLDAVPGVMWFVRCHMRRHRTRGLSVPQFRTLVLLRRYPGASLSLVAEHLGSSMPTASRLVTGLVGKGLLTRKGRADDRRQVTLALTAKGESVLDTAQAATRDGVAEKLEQLGELERKTLAAAMDLLGRVFAKPAAPDS
ncbi:MAG: MarR family winged helix-turn-helix transcriptional regulator [Phycisphaerae bacterium]|nr:MarR family transcriptional regulator [Tepidisphaeraceae bacterium]